MLACGLFLLAAVTAVAAAPPPPPGYFVITRATPVRPGMTIRHYEQSSGRWVEAEVLRTDGPSIAVVFNDGGSRRESLRSAGTFAITRATVDRLVRGRESFAASETLVPGTLATRNPDLVPVAEHLAGGGTLPVGTPVIRGDAGEQPTRTLAEPGGGRVRVEPPKNSTQTTFVSTDRLFLTPETIATLTDATVVAKNKQEAERVKLRTAANIRLADRPLPPVLPADAATLPEGRLIPEGTPVSIYDEWRTEFLSGRVVQTNPGGSLRVEFTDYFRRTRVEDLPRDQVVIAVDDRAAIDARQTDMVVTEIDDDGGDDDGPSRRRSPPLPKRSERTWTDASGQFSLRARFQERTGNTITLATDDGEEMEIDYTQLSVRDRAYLDGLD